MWWARGNPAFSWEWWQATQVVASHLTQCVSSRRIANFETPCADDETRTSQGFQGFGFGDGGFQMSFGIGAFPFGIFATAFNINDGRPPPGIYLRYEFVAQLCGSLSNGALSNVLWINTPHSCPGNAATHGWTVSLQTLPVCCPGHYVLVVDRLNDWKVIQVILPIYFGVFFLRQYDLKQKIYLIVQNQNHCNLKKKETEHSIQPIFGHISSDIKKCS